MRYVLLAGLVAVMACDDRELIVESNTSWSGFIDGDDAGFSRDGSGNATFELGSGTTCWAFQKDSEGGRLRVYAKTREVFGSDRHGDASTTAAYGAVSGCVE